jgi:hypothetical protein
MALRTFVGRIEGFAGKYRISSHGSEWKGCGCNGRSSGIGWTLVCDGTQAGDRRGSQCACADKVGIVACETEALNCRSHVTSDVMS